jgi:hypothetical protein
MAANEHKNLQDANRHNPMGLEAASNNSVLSKSGGTGAEEIDGILVWSYPLQTFVLSSDVPSTTAAVANGIDYVRIPYAFRLTEVRASCYTVGDGVTTIDIKEDGTTILSTSLTIDSAEKTSTTAATPAVISDYDLADDAEIRFDITGVPGTPPEGVKVLLIGYKR